MIPEGRLIIILFLVSQRSVKHPCPLKHMVPGQRNKIAEYLPGIFIFLIIGYCVQIPCKQYVDGRVQTVS